MQQLHCLHSIAALFISHLSVPILSGFHHWHIMLGMQTLKCRGLEKMLIYFSIKCHRKNSTTTIEIELSEKKTAIIGNVLKIG